MNIQIKHIGKSADDLRFFILADNQHAGGITVHSVNPPCFSYGIAITKPMRRRGVASAALLLLFDEMKQRGFTRALVQISPDNAASLALHRNLGFEQTGISKEAVTMTLDLESGTHK